MHHQIAVREIDRAEHREKKVQALLDREALRVGEGRDRQAVHPLQGEPGAPVGSDAAVEKAGDRRMLEAGEDLALLKEPQPRRRLVGARGKEFQRRGLIVGAVGPPDGVDRAHAAAAELPFDLPGAEPGAGGHGRPRRQFPRQERRPDFGCRSGQHPLFLARRGESGLESRPERQVFVSESRELVQNLFLGEVEQPVEQLVEARPTRHTHLRGSSAPTAHGEVSRRRRASRRAARAPSASRA